MLTCNIFVNSPTFERRFSLVAEKSQGISKLAFCGNHDSIQLGNCDILTINIYFYEKNKELLFYKVTIVFYQHNKAAI